jgi:hypothetical protein
VNLVDLLFLHSGAHLILCLPAKIFCHEFHELREFLMCGLISIREFGEFIVFAPAVLISLILCLPAKIFCHEFHELREFLMCGLISIREIGVIRGLFLFW